MATPQSPYQIAPPSWRRLLTSTGLALLGAVVLLVTVVLPAEYGIDPTGLGARMGLLALDTESPAAVGGALPSIAAGTQMDTAQATGGSYDEPVALPNPAVHQGQPQIWRSDTFDIAMAPGEELEYKAVVQQNQVMLYRWATDRGDVYFDFHADAPGAPEGFWVRYQEGEGSGASGSLTAPFTGNHGWFWQNYNDFPVTIRLEVAGYYDAVNELGRFNPMQQ